MTDTADALIATIRAQIALQETNILKLRATEALELAGTNETYLAELSGLLALAASRLG